MPQNLRQKQLIKFLQEQGFVTVEKLVQNFGVTPQTLRRDLNYLASQGYIVRHHGGAEGISSTVNTSYNSRKILNLNAKEKIAEAVAQSIPNGASLFINIGTTTETIAHALLNHKDLNIVTNNIHVATILSAKEDFSVIVAAGEVRHRDGGIIGEATCDFINNFNMDYGIIGISGIKLDGSLLDFDYREVKVAQAIINNSQTVILAADQSKFGRTAMVKQANISQIDQFYTDAKPPEPIQAILKAHQIATHIVSP